MVAVSVGGTDVVVVGEENHAVPLEPLPERLDVARLAVTVEVLQRSFPLVQAVHGQQHDGAVLRDAMQLGQPQVLHVDVEVGEDAVVDDEVEPTIRIRRGRRVGNEGELAERDVAAEPPDGVLVDIGAVEFGRDRQRAEVTEVAARPAPEVEQAAEVAELAIDRGQRPLQREQLFLG